MELANECRLLAWGNFLPVHYKNLFDFKIRTNTIVLYFNLLSEASALFWKKYYFRFVALNKTFGFKVYRIPDPGFDPGVRFPFFLIETPSI